MPPKNPPFDSSRSHRLLRSAVDAIGSTPLVELSRITTGRQGRILAKLEYLNPGFSKKDRIARQIIEAARMSGQLAPGQRVIELTSGNTGTGVAIVCAVLGHPFTAVMSSGNSEERARMMRALGGDVVIVPQLAGSRPGEVSGADLELVEAETQRLASALGAFRIDQFARAENSRAHEMGTAREIWEAAGGEIDAFADFVGSGGSFAGLYRGFAGRGAAIRGYIVEPAEASILATGSVNNACHAIQGGGYSMASLAQLDGIRAHGFIGVSDEEAREGARRLAREEGIFAGYSSGANVAAALRLLDYEERGSTIVILICDSGLKYLSTGLWA